MDEAKQCSACDGTGFEKPPKPMPIAAGVALGVAALLGLAMFGVVFAGIYQRHGPGYWTWVKAQCLKPDPENPYTLLHSARGETADGRFWSMGWYRSGKVYYREDRPDCVYSVEWHWS